MPIDLHIFKSEYQKQLCPYYVGCRFVVSVMRLGGKYVRPYRNIYVGEDTN